LKRLVSERDLAENFVFQPYQPREHLKHSLSVPDVHWISLRPEFEGLIVPSKIYGILAAGRPIIAITSHGGEIASIVRRYDCGLTVEPGDSNRLAEVIISWADDVNRRVLLGERARSALDLHFTRGQAFAKWARLLAAIERT
jgi:glycosyltransferase involved in cell wall biosynthesis